jgi:hypothetical protein
VIRACTRSLERLGAGYLDLYLIHWPNDEIPLKETMDALQYLVEEGMVRSLGVSNFDVDRLQHALDASEAPVCNDQVEYHPYRPRRELPQFCREHGIALSGMLSRSARHRLHEAVTEEDGERPSVGLLLEIDEEYRRKAERDQLHKIAPKRFNPESEAWLPVLHVKRQGWSFTALYSNTATAHRLGKTHDWVVIYYERGGAQQQCTVVTTERGALAGKRMIRGRERECREYYGVEHTAVKS